MLKVTSPPFPASFPKPCQRVLMFMRFCKFCKIKRFIYFFIEPLQLPPNSGSTKPDPLIVIIVEMGVDGPKQNMTTLSPEGRVQGEAGRTQRQRARRWRWNEFTENTGVCSRAVLMVGGGLRRAAGLEGSRHHLCGLFVSPLTWDLLVGKVPLELFEADMMTNIF